MTELLVSDFEIDTCFQPQADQLWLRNLVLGICDFNANP